MDTIPKRDVILLHGLFGSLSNWSTVIETIGLEYNVYAPELPLFNRSVRRNSLEQLVFYVEKYIKENKIVNPILIGNSLGGHVALLYALKNPNNFEKLVLAGSSGLFENTLSASFVRVKDYDYIKSKVEEVFETKEVITKELVDDVYSTANNPLKALSLIAIARDAKRQNLKDVLHKISRPVLLVWGKQDHVTPPEVAEEFYQHLPNSRLEYIDNCGHVPMMEQPHVFNKFLTQFLSA
ncbi:Pimeloyl-ACP methyl ester carboxylesterase [Chishuiella changwenlii]|uniref:Alpha/beta hydrolase n=1 Tax=Chishuiella changwenlii TaxID=1434701 RepID=A0A1M6T6E8_9FLAO|nr:alpha/beta hydrolase [Chishuiella changwenlii]GGE94990.1 alpha/beta hydrolase [Chishuiella changwenlii]SHK52494.1 Pimeloyl-ACP methyl ester carboxylesterase [Chishuiella changwenlii]